VIKLINPVTKRSLSLSGSDLVDEVGKVFCLRKGAYRFVEDDNYSSNFGFQWNKFEKTQIDRFQVSSNQSSERFFAVTNWDKEDLSGKNVLEVGSGAGRFSQIVLQHTNANLYSVDYSNAVEANFRNNGPHERLTLFQASIYELPFASAQFDKVFCFGVLQHTPDFRKSVECLIEMVQPGGELIVDFYPVKGWYTKLHAKYILRPFFKRMTHDKLLRWIDSNADRLIAASHFFDGMGVGRLINRFLPLCDINSTIPRGLTKKEQREWIILDTFDMFSPEFDHPQRLENVVEWFTKYRLHNVVGKVIKYGNGNTVTFVKGIKPHT
jgi:2-polyprenyl-3-methyl-5-hydroxy-6-metoxy-1,4-benzoquinol methylase